METATENKNQSTLQIIFGIAGVIGAIAIIAKLMGSSQEEQEHDTTEAAAAAARKKLYKEIPLSFNDQIYRDWADALDTALLQETGEDEDAVYQVFKDCKNISDVVKLIEMFGHRRDFLSYKYISLPQAITNKFNPGEKLKLNLILRRKNIPYSFK